MTINLSHYPDPKKTYSVSFENLSGGLNIDELDYRLKTNESPEMRNMWWQDGLLQCRDGQVQILAGVSGRTCYAVYERMFWEHGFTHCGDKIYVFDPTANEVALTQLIGSIAQQSGRFFTYGDSLYYKTGTASLGSFVKIQYDAETETFSAQQLSSSSPYVPTTVINANPATGSGDLYQSENRLSSSKKITYNITVSTSTVQLPVTNIDSVVSVKNSGTDIDYTVNTTTGVITLTNPLTPTSPVTNNTLEVVYSKANTTALNAIMSCKYAMVYGGTNGICILLSGCDTQPNAVFWNGNSDIGMEDSYWPMDNYQLVGDTEDCVTGFARQYSNLIVLKEHSVGKLNFVTDTVDDLNRINFTYEEVNSRIGCDLPGTIQTVENNVVFANTTQGVHQIRSASSAYENNIVCISKKVNGTPTQKYKPGILYWLSDAKANGNVVTSFDDDKRYWLCVDGKVYLWDYNISTYSDPSWFYFTNIGGNRFFADQYNRWYHFASANSRLSVFKRVFYDYNSESGGIDKLYRFSTQTLGGYDRLKDIDYILLAARTDTDTNMEITYGTDYEIRRDSVNAKVHSWKLSSRNLARRDLSTFRFAAVIKRKPGCRHIRHFYVSLANNTAAEDMSVASMKIFYRYQGKER